MAYLSTIREFPFCQVDTDVSTTTPGILIAPSRFPLSISKEDLFKWLYRVKIWQIDFNYTYTINIFDGLVVECIGVIEFTRVEADEAAFSCSSPEFSASGTLGYSGTWTQYNAPAAPYGGDLDLTIGLQIGVSVTDSNIYGMATSAHWLRDGSNYVPAINCSVTGIDPVSSDNYGTVANYDNEFFAPSGYTIGGTIDGVAIPIAVNTPTNITAFSGTFDIIPVEYWEYDPGDGGGPVYDNLTGIELRDPASINL